MNTDIPVSSHVLFNAIIDNWDVDTTHTHILRLARDWGYDSFGVELARKLLEQSGYEVRFTEEELEEPEADEDGWIEWGGGNCPVASHESVYVRFRSGEEDYDGDTAAVYSWTHIQAPYDITHYRVVED